MRPMAEGRLYTGNYLADPRSKHTSFVSENSCGSFGNRRKLDIAVTRCKLGANRLSGNDDENSLIVARRCVVARALATSVDRGAQD